MLLFVLTSMNFNGHETFGAKIYREAYALLPNWCILYDGLCPGKKEQNSCIKISWRKI